MTYHIGDMVSIRWEEHQIERLGLEQQTDFMQGEIVRVSNATADDWVLHRVKLWSGKEVSVHPSQLTLLQEA